MYTSAGEEPVEDFEGIAQNSILGGKKIPKAQSKEHKKREYAITFEEFRNSVGIYDRLERWNYKVNKDYRDNDLVRRILKGFQYNTVMYMSGYSLGAIPRGLLLYFQMGCGKTLTAVATALYCVNMLPEYTNGPKEERIVFLVSKMLKINAEKEIYFYTDLLNRVELDVMFSPNSGEPLKPQDLLAEFQFIVLNDPVNFTDKFTHELNFTHGAHKFVIIDEAHNMIRAANNNSGSAYTAYQKLMGLKTIELLLLSGSVVANDFKELALLFQMLSGNENLFATKQHKVSATRIEFNSNFNDFFTKHSLIVNKQIFVKRIAGLVSFVEMPESSTMFPRLLDTQYIQLKITHPAYAEEYKKEHKQEIISGDSFMSKTRELSNYTVIGKTIESPKFKFIWENVRQDLTQKTLVFSQFLDGGIIAFIQYIEANKGNMEIVEVDPRSRVPLNSGEFGYMLISGSVSIEERKEMLKCFNDPKNAEGEICSMILFSPASAEGVSLKCVRKVFIMEPEWSYALMRQIIFRAYRMHGHSELPYEKETLEPYFLLSYVNDTSLIENFHDKVEPHINTDAKILMKVIQKNEITQEFKSLIELGSITCSIYERLIQESLKSTQIKCFRCGDGSSGELFDPHNMYADVRNHKCELPINTTKTDATITYNNVEYGWYYDIYVDGNICIYDRRDESIVDSKNGKYKILLDLVKSHINDPDEFNKVPEESKPIDENFAVTTTTKKQVMFVYGDDIPKNSTPGQIMDFRESKRGNFYKLLPEFEDVPVKVLDTDLGRVSVSKLASVLVFDETEDDEHIETLIEGRMKNKKIFPLMELLDDQYVIYGHKRYNGQTFLTDLITPLYLTELEENHSYILAYIRKHFCEFATLIVELDGKNVFDEFMVSELLNWTCNIDAVGPPQPKAELLPQAPPIVEDKNPPTKKKSPANNKDLPPAKEPEKDPDADQGSEEDSNSEDSNPENLDPEGDDSDF